MGRLRRAGGPNVVKVRTRRERKLKDTLKKAAIWAFIGIFVLSIVGVAIVTVSR